MCDVDPDCGVAVLNLYMGVMKVVPLSFGEGGGELAAFNVKYVSSTPSLLPLLLSHMHWCGEVYMWKL